MKHPEKGDGFPGQRIVVLPRTVLAQAREQPLLHGLMPTDIGSFPRARGHLRERKDGVDQAIFIYCARGEGWCELSGARHRVHGGEVLVIPPGVPHVYGADSKRPWTIHWFHARGGLLADFLAQLDATVARPVLFLGDSPPWLALFEEVLGALEHGYTPPQLLHASQALAHLLAVMIRHRQEHWREPPDARQKIFRTIVYMKQHLDQPLQLAALAALAGLSRSRYSALFKQQTRYAPMDYFLRLRLHRACQLLDTTSLSVKEVANTLGYADPLYFSRVFRSVNDLTPTDYRKLRKG